MYTYDIRSGVKKIKTKTALAISGATLGLAGLVMAVAVPLGAHAATNTIYNDIPSPTAGNYPSQPFEAQSASEFGGQVQFAGTARENPQVTVLMSSWGCEGGSWTNTCTTTAGSTFSEPITLSIYNVNSDNTPGTLVKSVTQTFQIPYRPSTSQICGDGRWSSDGTVANCFNGYATPVTFNVGGTTLPNKAIISVAYSTTHNGYNPYGEATTCYTTDGGCGYDSLNVALTGTATTGTQPVPDSAYFNTSFAAFYCDGGVGGTGTFRLDSGCWTGFQPMLKVEAGFTMPTNKDQCKGDGWKAYGTTFKNQGDCVSFVATAGKNQPNVH